MYKDIWIFHKKYIDCITDDVEFWDNVACETIALSKKYGECEFMLKLLTVEVDEFDRVFREMKKCKQNNIKNT